MENSFKIPCNVLVIDDDFVSNFVSKTTINKFSKEINCITYENPIIGLEYLEKNSKKIDLLLLDINMPGIDGWHILDTMKKNNIKTPVFMLSSSINPKEIERALGYGIVNAFWQKPLKIETIQNCFSDN